MHTTATSLRPTTRRIDPRWRVVDIVVASVLGVASTLFFFAGLGPRQFLRRTLPVAIAAVFTATTILLYGRASGTSHWRFLLVNVTDGSIELSIATLLGVLAIGLPAVVLFVTVDPTDLADGLAQVLRLPSRFVLGALGGLRLVGLFAEDWKSLELASRARGIADSGRLRRFAGQAFALLVLSIRRGSKLPTAMEARGFGSSILRSWARESRSGGREWILVALSFAIALAAVSTSVLTEHWNFLAGACDGTGPDGTGPDAPAPDAPTLLARIRLAPRPVVLIDGGSGSGKTTLAAALAPALAAQLVRLDDFYPGWDGLESASAAVRDDVLAPVSPRWQRWDWTIGALAEWHPLDATLPLVIEGSGCLSRANRGRATFALWVELDAPTRKERALARDGDAYEPHWDRWAAQERNFGLREHPWRLADIVLGDDDVTRLVDGLALMK